MTRTDACTRNALWAAADLTFHGFHPRRRRSLAHRPHPLADSCCCNRTLDDRCQTFPPDGEPCSTLAASKAIVCDNSGGGGERGRILASASALLFSYLCPNERIWSCRYATRRPSSWTQDEQTHLQRHGRRYQAVLPNLNHRSDDIHSSHDPSPPPSGRHSLWGRVSFPDEDATTSAQAARVTTHRLCCSEDVVVDLTFATNCHRRHSLTLVLVGSVCPYFAHTSRAGTVRCSATAHQRAHVVLHHLGLRSRVHSLHWRTIAEQ